MENFELVPLHNGVISLRCLEPREVFHPAIGPEAEAKLLHVEQLRIVERARAATDEFHLWDVGLGAGANVLAAIRAFRAGLPAGRKVLIKSFDKTTSPIRFALEHAQELGYVVGFEDAIHELLASGVVQISDDIRWELHGDFTSEVRSKGLRGPDAVFYDPYSAKGNPEMWSLETFSALRARLEDDRLCLLSNYTASTYVRVTMLLAGFCVGTGCAVDKKTQTTIFSNRLEALEKPLDLEWLAKRVRVSHSAAPIRKLPHVIAPLDDEDYEWLRGLPQFRPHKMP